MYLILEYINGGDLFQTYPRNHVFPHLKLRSLAKQLLEGVNEMSSRSYLHRDLKPSNIFIQNNSDLREIPADLDDIVIKIGDLGLTSKYDDVLSSVLCGTPGYIAPEVLKNSEFHPNSDMFSVGCILYQFMVGEALFSSTNREILMMKNTSFQIGELDSLYHTQQSNI